MGINEIGVYTHLAQHAHCVNFVMYLGLFTDATHHHLCMEFCEYGDAFSWVKEQGPAQVAEPVIRRSMRQVVNGVRHLHTLGIGHRDISLENILIKVVGGEHIWKLMDFGQSVLILDANGQPIRYWRHCGKHYYRAPEVYVPKKPLPRVN